MDLTVPVDSSSVTRAEVERSQWSETCSWEFDSKLDGLQYKEWVTNKLKDEFKFVKSSDDSLLFAKNLSNDTETIVVRLKPNRGTVHVRVDVKVVPD